MVEVFYTDEFGAWFEDLSEGERDQVFNAVGYLKHYGVTLGAPYSSALNGARHALRELRVRQGASPLRVAYAFDPRRNAVLLLGGDKSGVSSSDAFYKKLIANADRIFDEYLAEQARGEHDKE